jgi:hypothetical protein
MNKSVYITIGQLIQALKLAYIASCKALGLANKLKASKSRILGQMNRLRAELKKWEAKIVHGLDMVCYSGCIAVKLNKFGCEM